MQWSAQDSDSRGTIVNIWRRDYGGNGTIAVNGRGVFNTEFAESTEEYSQGRRIRLDQVGGGTGTDLSRDTEDRRTKMADGKHGRG